MVRRLLWLTMASTLAVSSGRAAPLQTLSVSEAVGLYERGDWDAGVSVLAKMPTLTVAALTRELEAWIGAADSEHHPRRLVVATAFALDAAWRLTRPHETELKWSHDPWKLGTPNPDRIRVGMPTSASLTARWTAQALSRLPTQHHLERLLWLSAVGTAESDFAWRIIERDILPSASKRLPDEPRLRLTAVLAKIHIELDAVRARSARRSDVLRQEPIPRRVTDRIPQAIASLESLLRDPTLRPEIELRIGYLEMRRQHWSGALARFDAARQSTDEDTLRAAADYFSGWIHEQAGRHDAAIACYLRAHAIVPIMRNLSFHLAAALFLRGQPEKAHAVLDGALRAQPQPSYRLIGVERPLCSSSARGCTVTPQPVDLLIAVERADARFVQGWLDRIRRSLR